MDILEDNDISYHDLGNMFLNPDEMKTYLKKLKVYCNKFYTKIDESITESISKNSEHAKQIEKSSEAIFQLMNQKKELKNELNNVKLEQSIVEKKAINTIKEIEKTKTEIDNFKEKKEKILLEIVDIDQDFQKAKDNMKKQWDAIKKACSVYKNILNIHIDTETIDNNVQQITVDFFWNENPTDYKFFVILTCEDNRWKVKKIQPELSLENKYLLNHIVQFSKQSDIADVTLLLCELRKLYLKHYF